MLAWRSAVAAVLAVATVGLAPQPSIAANAAAANPASAWPARVGFPIDSPDPDPNGSGLFGMHATAVPDVDGDRRDDFAVADPYEDVSSPESAYNDGRVYLFSGATAELLHDVASPQPARLGYFGDGIAGVPDVDGDGRGELLVGAWGEPVEGDREAGHAYLFSGSTGELIHSFTSPNAEGSSNFSWGVTGLADVDGDGSGDVAIGAPFETVAGRSGAGRVYLFSGRTGTLLRTLVSPNPQVGTSSFFGGALSSGGDLNGDDRADVIVGAHQEKVSGYPFNGRAYVFSGATGAVLATLEPQELARSRDFGRSVSAVPDTTGDGVSDIAVGSQEIHDFNRPWPVELFDGASGAFVRDLLPDSSGVAGFGGPISGVPDIDGDGLGDVVAGAPDSLVGGRVNAGRTFVFGSQSPSFELRPPERHAGAAFGSSVAGLSDIDGDGRGDTVVGADLEFVGPRDISNGAAYLFRSGGLPFTATVAPVDAGPVVIGPDGGSFRFRVTITNFTATTQQVSVWTEASLASGAGIGPLFGPQDATLKPGQTLGPIFLEQDVPASAPAGEIFYRVTVRTLAGDVNQTDQFTVVKQPGGSAAQELDALGWTVRPVDAPS